MDSGCLYIFEIYPVSEPLFVLFYIAYGLPFLIRFHLSPIFFTHIALKQVVKLRSDHSHNGCQLPSYSG